MIVECLKSNDVEAVMELFCECFKDDHYYNRLFERSADGMAQMRSAFRPSIEYCLKTGLCSGVTDAEKLVAFTLCFEYGETRDKDPQQFSMIFGAEQCDSVPHYNEIHKQIRQSNHKSIYLLSIAVDPAYRKKGLASGLIDAIIRKYPGCNLVSDVSNEGSLEIYRRRDFRIDEIEDGYYFIFHPAEQPQVQFEAENGSVSLMVPDASMLELHGIPFQIIKREQLLVGFRHGREFDVHFFAEAASSVCAGCLVSLDYHDFLRYQRLINVSQYAELCLGGCVLYAQTRQYLQPPLMNETLSSLLKNRATEWAVIPDVYISIPVEYADLSLLRSSEQDATASDLLRYLDFRTYYEVGVPSRDEDIDALANMKNRLTRIYLGKIRMQILNEPTIDAYETTGEGIGPLAYVDMYILVDRNSKCAVLTIYSLSCPFLISHLLDNMVRNRLAVQCGDKTENLFSFLKQRFGLLKQGTPKSYVIIPQERNCLTSSQIASLISSETIYPDGENFGIIIDSEIITIANTPNGMGQYDRSQVFAYTNVVLQFSEDLVGALNYRISEESITLFYIELILLEEAAICIADREMIKLATSPVAIDPIEFLKCVDSIYDDYSRTIDFWDITVNYPTSQKSVGMLRTAFRIEDRLNRMKRSQEHLQTVFDTKCDMIDRRDSKRMDTSLAIISVLAIFSAWIDGHDYIATWDDVLSGSIIHLLQRVLFIAILITAGYVVTHLFGNKLRMMMRIRRVRKRDQTKASSRRLSP